MHINSADDLIIIGNKELLRPAIENVVRNAVQYTKENTTVDITVKTDGIDGESNSTRLGVITVRDHGQGVPENALAEIFRPFYRVDDARDRESGGTGLGLAITERAVRLHGGSVTAMNAADGGLAVTIKLPCGDS